MSLMLGLILGFGTSLLVSTISWLTYRSLAEPNECRLIQQCLAVGAGSQNAEFRVSRPGMLLAELEGVSQYPDLAIAVLNEALGEVDSSTNLGLQTAKKLARASLAAGIAGACIELAMNIRNSALQAAWWGLAATAAGLLGTLSCTVIGHRAMFRFARRRRLWDKFVQWILNSQFSRSELSLPVDNCESPDGAQSALNS